MSHSKLDIILLCDDYLPESTRIHAKMMHELAKKFTTNGHRPVVLTLGDARQKARLESIKVDGIEVWRFRSPNFRGKGKVWRAINETLLPMRALFALFTSEQFKTVRFDLCVNYSPTIFFAPIAKHLRKKGVFVYLVLRDFFPQWAIDRGLLKQNSLVTSFFRYIEQLNYRSSDVIAVQSPANIPVFKNIYPNDANVRILMNWSEQEKFRFDNQQASKSLRKRLGLFEHQTLFFYGGNIGHAQDMMNIVQLAVDLKSDKRAHFLVVGQGDEFGLVQDQIKQNKLTNFTLLPSVPQEVYREYVAIADIGLFSLSKFHKTHNFPGKLLNYMVESLPILGSVNAGNDVVQTINDASAGAVSLNGDRAQFLHDAKLMLDNPEIRKEMGICAAKLLETTFSVNTAYDEIISSYLRGNKAS